MTLRVVSEEADAPRLIRYRDYKLIVHHEMGLFARLQVNADEDIVKAFTQLTRQVLVINSVQELRLVKMATEGVSNAGVSQCTKGAEEL